MARAAVVHPELRQGAVRTVLTLSSPHRYMSYLFRYSLEKDGTYPQYTLSSVLYPDCPVVVQFRRTA